MSVRRDSEHKRTASVRTQVDFHVGVVWVGFFTVAWFGFLTVGNASEGAWVRASEAVCVCVCVRPT